MKDMDDMGDDMDDDMNGCLGLKRCDMKRLKMIVQIKPLIKVIMPGAANLRSSSRLFDKYYYNC